MWHNAVAAVLLLLSQSSVPSWTLTLQDIVQRSYQGEQFKTLLLLRHGKQGQECNQMEQIATTGNLTILSFTETADFRLKSTQSFDMLAMICLTNQGEHNMELWSALARNLHNMRSIRLIVMLEKQEQLTDVVNRTQQLRFPHVVVLLSSGSTFQLQPYSKDSWLKIETHSNQSIFRKQYNYQGLAAITLSDQFIANSVIYRDKMTQEITMMGFVARLIQEFARLHNVTLKWHESFVLGKQIQTIALRNLTRNGTLDLPISLAGFENPSEYGYCSYPYQFSKWFLTVPCPQEITTAEVYTMIFSYRIIIIVMTLYYVFTLLDACFNYFLLGRNWNWTYLIVNERMISGIIGQSLKLCTQFLKSAKMTHAQLFVVGLMVSTIFGAHLQTLLTKRPSEQKISNLFELRDSNLAIYFDEDTRFYLKSSSKRSPIQIIKSKIEFIPTDKYVFHLNNFNKSSALAMITENWDIIDRQQRLFKKPLFCFYPQLVIAQNLLIAVAMQANSIYVEPMNQLIHRIHASGLVEYWKEESLRSLVSLGKVSLKDPNQNRPFHEFKVEDLFWVWVGLAVGLLLGLIGFLGELVVFQLKRKVVREKIVNL